MSDYKITVGAGIGGGATFTDIEDGDYETAGVFTVQPDLGVLARIGSRGASEYQCAPDIEKKCEESRNDVFLRFEVAETTAFGGQGKGESMSGTRVLLTGGAGAEIHRVVPYNHGNDVVRFVMQLTGGVASMPVGEVDHEKERWGGYINSGFYVGGSSILFGARLTTDFFPDEMNFTVNAGPRIDF